jgi:anaerobic magnesium-protoporphyrin IX monomethyl ester cyclase
MKIVLTTMPSEGEYRDWTTHKYFKVDKINRYMPLGTLSLATNLPEGHEVVVFDPPSYNWSIEETIQRIEEAKPDVLGLSVVNKRCYAMTKILAKTTCKYKCVGGPHVTYHAPEILAQGADAVFHGPLADKEFAEAIVNKPKGHIYCNTNINEIRFPSREFLKVEDYFPQTNILFKADNRLPMFSSVGCVNRCTFCSVQSKQMHLKDAAEVVKEMKYLQSLGCRSIHILDDNFNLNRTHLSTILDQMTAQGFVGEWSARGQTKMDFRLVPKMVQCGFRRIHVGIEALDDGILKFFNKNETCRDIIAFCETMIINNVSMVGYFILGSPIESDQYRRTLALRIRKLGITMPLFNILFPEPDTAYYRSLLADGIYKTDIWAEYFKNPVADYVPEYPYGPARQKEVMDFADKITADFNKGDK